ncbi:transposase-like protein [Paraburkholderia sp. BL8N3]|nr:transposase-like protein [Paraburkholderia sp. BL8N3]
MSKLKSLEELFAGRHFDRDVIILCVRWYVRDKLSLRDLMAERGLSLADTTVLRWVWRFAPEFVKRWICFGRSTGQSWPVDESYLLLGRQVGLSLSSGGSGGPDGRLHVQRHARREGRCFLPEDMKVRSSTYLNNLVEQDHRNIKSRTKVMLGFKRFRNAAITLSGIELVHRLVHRIRKGQFSLAKLGPKDTAAPAVWEAVLSA